LHFNLCRLRFSSPPHAFYTLHLRKHSLRQTKLVQILFENERSTCTIISANKVQSGQLIHRKKGGGDLAQMRDAFHSILQYVQQWVSVGQRSCWLGWCVHIPYFQPTPRCEQKNSALSKTSTRCAATIMKALAPWGDVYSCHANARPGFAITALMSPFRAICHLSLPAFERVHGPVSHTHTKC
jgi:hypothetical protein